MGRDVSENIDVRQEITEFGWRITGKLITWPKWMCVIRESDGARLFGGHMWNPSRDNDECPECGITEAHTVGQGESDVSNGE